DPIYSNFEIIPSTIEEEDPGNSFSLLMLIYGFVFGVLIIRFIRNLYDPIFLVKQSENHYDGRKTLILCDKEISPFCFMNWIFVNKTAYQTNKIEPEILTHEFAHAVQNHSVDVILVELLITLFWFNPFLYLYRKAIRLNHEFLADEAVLIQFNDPLTYQKLMLTKVAPNINFALSNSFNFFTTKKRLVMMTVSTSTVIRILKQCTLLPILTLIILLFGERTFAQLEEEWEGPKIFKTAVIEQDIVAEFEKLLKEFQEKEPDEMSGNRRKFSKEEYNQIQALENLYKNMNEAQKDQYSRYFLKVSNDRKMPSFEQFESFKDEKMYGVWLDGKRIKNSDLNNNYSNKDIYRFHISRLTKTAKNYGIHVYQLHLYTNENYEERKKNGSLRYYLLDLKQFCN
nr:M56 family metallopeptidase [Flammeovirgaceae bacterium]